MTTYADVTLFAQQTLIPGSGSDPPESDGIVLGVIKQRNKPLYLCSTSQAQTVDLHDLGLCLPIDVPTGALVESLEFRCA
jgi:hypothetical protein